MAKGWGSKLLWLYKDNPQKILDTTELFCFLTMVLVTQTYHVIKLHSTKHTQA